MVPFLFSIFFIWEYALGVGGGEEKSWENSRYIRPLDYVVHFISLPFI